MKILLSIITNIVSILLIVLILIQSINNKKDFRFDNILIKNFDLFNSFNKTILVIVFIHFILHIIISI